MRRKRSTLSDDIMREYRKREFYAKKKEEKAKDTKTEQYRKVKVD